mmetsp:Transcript_29826/g.74997  ORF Transcript_29826/g.74997 Transcript_29826/m.74997 type:complete len:408 (+) Transcript_29826:3-1226(+)
MNLLREELHQQKQLRQQRVLEQQHGSKEVEATAATIAGSAAAVSGSVSASQAGTMPGNSHLPTPSTASTVSGAPRAVVQQHSRSLVKNASVSAHSTGSQIPASAEGVSRKGSGERLSMCPRESLSDTARRPTSRLSMRPHTSLKRTTSASTSASSSVSRSNSSIRARSTVSTLSASSQLRKPSAQTSETRRPDVRGYTELKRSEEQLTIEVNALNAKIAGYISQLASLTSEHQAQIAKLEKQLEDAVQQQADLQLQHSREQFAASEANADLRVQLVAQQQEYTTRMENMQQAHEATVQQIQAQLSALEDRLEETHLCLETHGFDPVTLTPMNDDHASSYQPFSPEEKKTLDENVERLQTSLSHSLMRLQERRENMIHLNQRLKQVQVMGAGNVHETEASPTQVQVAT